MLSALVFEPIRWNTRFGWRPLTRREAGDLLLLAGGRPPHGDKGAARRVRRFERFNLDYERAHFEHTDAGHTIAVATRDLRRGRATCTPCSTIHSSRRSPCPRPAPWFRRLVEAGLRARARVVRLLPARRRPRLRTLELDRSYPAGYELEALGPSGSR